MDTMEASNQAAASVNAPPSENEVCSLRVNRHFRKPLKEHNKSFSRLAFSLFYAVDRFSNCSLTDCCCTCIGSRCSFIKQFYFNKPQSHSPHILLSFARCARPNIHVCVQQRSWIQIQVPRSGTNSARRRRRILEQGLYGCRFAHVQQARQGRQQFTKVPSKRRYAHISISNDGRKEGQGGGRFPTSCYSKTSSHAGCLHDDVVWHGVL